MSKFQTIFESNLKTAALKRVKIKLDPKYAAREEYTGLEGYIGYILAEDTENVTVYVEGIGDGSIEILPISCIERTQDPKLSRLSRIAMDYVVCIKKITKGKVFDNILVAPSADALEVVLKELGCTLSDILTIYKGYYYAV